MRRRCWRLRSANAGQLDATPGQAVHERAKQADIVITTALIPGRKAPTLLSAETVAQMKPGSVVIDLAAARGGNCPLTVADQVVQENGVIIVGPTNLPARWAPMPRRCMPATCWTS